MPRFKVKDLMIDVLPAKMADLGDLELCRIYHSCLEIISKCVRSHTPCPWNSWDACLLMLTDWCERIHTLRIVACNAGTKIEIDPGEWVVNPRDLDILHEQLQVGLKRIEFVQHQVAEEMAPKTVEEVEALEGKLHDALGELDALKNRMQKG